MESLAVKLILGSQSPRRQELLQREGFDLELIAPDIDEVFPEGMSYFEVPEYLSVQKMNAVYAILNQDNDFILCADTVVIFNDILLGKPDNLLHAFEILKAMNGNEHYVVTGVTIRKDNRLLSFSEKATVKFKVLSDAEILNYIQTSNPLDKAGAYNIQDYPGFDKAIGAFENVMGLPIKRVVEEVKNWDIVS